MAGEDPESTEPKKPETPSAAENVGRAAGFLAKFAVRGALRSKTVREQIRDARTEADRPLDS